MTRRASHGLTRLVVGALVAVAAIPVSGIRPVAAATPTDLFFSEYIEGGLNNKALEIYNGTGAPVDLDAGNYIIEVYSNGSFVATTTLSLTGVLADGDVYVVAHPAAVAGLVAAADVTATELIFNGNDAVVLRHSASLIPVDLIGQTGVDTVWSQGGVSTDEQTLRRKATVTDGRTDNDPFDPSIEWNGLAGVDASDLGSHSLDTGDPGEAGGVVDATVTVPTSAACLELSTTSIDFGLVLLGAVDASATPVIGVTNCSGSSGIVYARGTDAAGPGSAAWDLVDSSATCGDALGVDAYHLRLAGDGTVQLGIDNKSLGSVASGATTNQAARIDTACPGSSGGGTTMTFQILFLATEG